jgi:hypothetical protein
LPPATNFPISPDQRNSQHLPQPKNTQAIDPQNYTPQPQQKNHELQPATTRENIATIPRGKKNKKGLLFFENKFRA